LVETLDVRLYLRDLEQLARVFVVTVDHQADPAAELKGEMPVSGQAAPVLGHLAVSVITMRHIADYLATLAGTLRTQQAIRSVLLDFFREAIAAGWRPDNPVAPTRSERVETQRGRLSLEQFRAIHAWSIDQQPAWATRAIELALVTAQRRADIAAMLFAQAREGHLWIERGKGGATVAIPLGLHLDAVGWTVGDVVARRRDGVLSRGYLVHHTAHTGRAGLPIPHKFRTVSNFSKNAGVYAEGWVLDGRGHAQSTRLK
jgi:hypothetical protein